MKVWTDRMVVLTFSAWEAETGRASLSYVVRFYLNALPLQKKSNPKVG